MAIVDDSARLRVGSRADHVVPINEPAQAFQTDLSSSDLAAESFGRIGDLLHRVTLTVNSTLELKEVLTQLADLAMEAIPADRCHLFLLDDTGTKLIPTFSIGRVTDMRLWRRFKEMDPIDLKEVPARWQAFSTSRSIAITDMSTSPIVPKELVKVFGSRSALISRLDAKGEPLGIFSLDWVGKTREFDYEEIQLVEAISAYAALAIRNARLYESLQRKARTLERLVGLAGALNSSLSLRPLLELVCEAFEELLGTSHCSVNTIVDNDPKTLHTLAVRGDKWFTSRPESVRAVSPKEIARVNKLWKNSAQPVVYPNWEEQTAVDCSLIPAVVRSAALFPLVSGGKLHGFVVAGFPKLGAHGSESLEYGQALADQAATAIARAELHEQLQQRLQRVEVLFRLSDVIAGSTDINRAIRKLNRVLRTEVGISLVSICISNSKVREAVGARAPGRDEIEAIRSWRASLARTRKPPSPRKVDGRLLVPVVHRSRVQGALTVAIENNGDPAEAGLLGTIAAGCAEVIYKASLHRDLADTERRLAVAAERDRIARDLHDSVGQLLTAMGMHLSEYAAEAPDITWRRRLLELLQLTTKGGRDVREAIHSLLFLEVRKRGLARSLKDLVEKFQATTGIDTTFKVEGEIQPLIAAHEDALFRVVHEGLMNVERHSRASFVTILLAYREEEVAVRIRDDGVGLVHREPFGTNGRHFGLRTLERLMEEVGGSLEVRNAGPRGVVVEGRIPRDDTKWKGHRRSDPGHRSR